MTPPPDRSSGFEPSEPETPGEGEPERKPARRPGFRESLRATREALAPIGRRRVLAATVGLMSIATVGILVFSGVSFWWTSQPSFCGRCHVMDPYIESWEHSPHQEVNCERCHLPPGVFGFVGGKIAGLQVVMNYLRGRFEDYSFNAAVSNASCLQCHEDILEHNVHGAQVEVSHLDIVEAGGKCMSCHSTVAHGEAVPVGSATHPTMDKCLTCHNDETAPLKCSLCHTGRGRNGLEEMPAEAGAAAEPSG